jgi:hypothetical protein
VTHHLDECRAALCQTLGILVTGTDLSRDTSGQFDMFAMLA